MNVKTEHVFRAYRVKKLSFMQRRALLYDRQDPKKLRVLY